MNRIFAALVAVVICGAWLAFAQEPFATTEATSQPALDPICEAVVALAAKDTAAFDEAMVAVSADLSDEEFGRYSRLYKSNFVGESYPDKVRHAYESSPITAHAMQAAALSMLQAEARALQVQIAEIQKQMQGINGEFVKYRE